MFLLFSFAICQSHRPLFCIHGLAGIDTTATLTGLISKCPNMTVNTTLRVWEPEPSIKDTNPDCIGYFLETQLGSAGTIESNTNFYYNIPSFPSIEGIKVFKHLKPYLENKGYTYKKDLFGAPYNWVFYPLASEGYFSQLKSSIEVIHKITGMKVVILGNSLGTHVVRRFVTRIMEPEWVREHVDGVIFSEPAFLGCTGVFDYIIQGAFSLLRSTPYIAEISRRMPSVQVLFNNYVAYNDTIFIKDYPGIGNITAREVKDFLINTGMFSETAQEIFKQVEETLQEVPISPPVRSLILYNSAIPTLSGYSGKNLAYMYGKGDGLCNSDGSEYACRTWENVECVDFNQNVHRFSHGQMLDNEEAMDKIYNFLTVNKEGVSSSVKENNALTVTLISLSIVFLVFVVILVLALVFTKKDNN